MCHAPTAAIRSSPTKVPTNQGKVQTTFLMAENIVLASSNAKTRWVVYLGCYKV